ncbi:hypothetical protein Ndes2437B_g08746 [Nannochloris sp. 'desiccata']
MVGPRNCGKSRLLETLAQQYAAEEIGPLYLNIDSRMTPYKKLLTALGPLPTKPVIVIDEANELIDWTEPDASQPKLKELLNFLLIGSLKLE